MNRLTTTRALLLASIATTAFPASAINIEFNYDFDSGGFFTADRRSTLESAASFFETRLTDSLTAISSGGGNSFSVNFTRPDNDQAITLGGQSIAADTLVVYVGGRDISGTALGEGGPGGWNASGSAAFLDGASRRGQGTTQGAGATDFAPWGGSITFDSATSWYFDTDTSTDEAFAGFDFFSVALHELSHVLGFGTAASWDNKVTGSVFNSAATGTVNLADPAHWATNTTSFVDGVQQTAAMTPSIGAGQRKRMTDLDLAALSAVGWEVAPAAPVPLPAGVWLLLSGAGLLAGRFRYRTSSAAG
jgi:hypothetical protein